MFDEFCEKVSTAAGALPVSWPGVPFTPPDSGQWLQVIWNQAGVEDYAYSDTDSGVEVGFFRVLVRDKDANGIEAAQTTASGLASAIGKGAQLGNAFVTEPPAITGPVMDDQGQNIIITVTWRYRTH